MKNICSALGLLLVAIACGGCATISKGTAHDVPDRSSVLPDDARAIQGNWRPTKAELAGRPMADAILKIISLRLDNGAYEVFVGEAPDRGTYTLDSSTEPKSMTVTGTTGPNSGKTFPAIYEINGDTLCICYDLSGAKRPIEFKSIAGTRLYLVTYNRKKE